MRSAGLVCSVLAPVPAACCASAVGPWEGLYELRDILLGRMRCALLTRGDTAARRLAGDRGARTRHGTPRRWDTKEEEREGERSGDLDDCRTSHVCAARCRCVSARGARDGGTQRENLERARAAPPPPRERDREIGETSVCAAASWGMGIARLRARETDECAAHVHKYRGFLTT